MIRDVEEEEVKKKLPVFREDISDSEGSAVDQALLGNYNKSPNEAKPKTLSRKKSEIRMYHH